MLHVTSTVPEYLQLRNVAPAARIDAWADQYEAAHAELFDVYYAGYGTPAGRAAAAARVPELAQEIGAREQRVRAALEDAAAEFTAHGLMRPEHDVDVVLMVGTGFSDAWVAVVGDRPVLFVALEMLGDPKRDTLLVLHELVHVLHVRALLPLLQADPGLEHHVGMRVWLEGVAVAATRRLRPGMPDPAYFFVPDDGWSDACRAALPRLAGSLLPHLDTSDPLISYSFCGVTDQHPWPSRAGYWLGDAVVSELLDSGYELSQLLVWGPDRITRAIRESLDPERPPEGRAR